MQFNKINSDEDEQYWYLKGCIRFLLQMYIHIIEIPIYLFSHHYHSPSILLLFKLLSSSCFVSFMSRCTLFTSPLSVILQLSCSSVFLYKSRSCSITTYFLEIHLNLFARLSPLSLPSFWLTRFLPYLSLYLSMYLPLLSLFYFFHLIFFKNLILNSKNFL